MSIIVFLYLKKIEENEFLKAYPLIDREKESKLKRNKINWYNDDIHVELAIFCIHFFCIFV